jgi:hypothetical protein
MSDNKEFDANKLFNDVSKAMQDDDNGNTLSELLAQETPEEEEHLEEAETPDPEGEPKEEVEEKEKSPHEEEEELEGSDSDKKADKTKGKEKEQTPEEKQVAELREQLAAAQREAQALRSQAGRVPSLQRKMAELDKKLEELKAASPSSQTSTKIKPKVDKLLESLKETDPALAETFAAAIATAIEGVDEESRTREVETLTLLREQSHADYVEEQKQQLLSMYPNAPQVFASPHWAEWKKSQPQHILDLAGSSSAEAVAMAFDLYKKDMTAKYPELVQKESVAATQGDPEAVKKAEQLEQERLKKKKNAVNIDTSKSSVRSDEPKDPNALFNKLFAEISAEISGK